MSSRRQRPEDMEAYEQFSEVYDLLGYDRFTKLALNRCRDELAHSELEVSQLLDLGCGTGHFAIEFARMGVDVTGVDGSPGMLRKAARNAGRMKNSPRWIHGYFTDFSVPGRYELVTCWFDSLNHLTTDREMLACFRRVRRLLKPEGTFMFDVNTPVAFRDRWTMSNYRSTEDYALFQQGMAEPGGEFGRLELEVFLRRGIRYERRKLSFRQRGYTASRLRKLLKQARLNHVTITAFDAQDSLSGASRLMVCAKQ